MTACILNHTDRHLLSRVQTAQWPNGLVSLAKGTLRLASDLFAIAMPIRGLCCTVSWQAKCMISMQYVYAYIENSFYSKMQCCRVVSRIGSTRCPVNLSAFAFLWQRFVCLYLKSKYIYILYYRRIYKCVKREHFAHIWNTKGTWYACSQTAMNQKRCAGEECNENACTQGTDNHRYI